MIIFNIIIIVIIVTNYKICVSVLLRVCLCMCVFYAEQNECVKFHFVNYACIL